MVKKRPVKRAAGKTKRMRSEAQKRQKQAARVRARRTRVAQVRARSISRAAVGACLDLIAAGEIVQDVIPGGPHDIDTTLENAGLITAAQRAVFRADVVRNVSARGCSIDADDIPNSASTTLRDARTAIQQNAG